MSVARSLEQLEELCIENCRELKHLITSEGEDFTNAGDSSHLMFPKLKKLSVKFCLKLEFIFPISFSLGGLLQLQEIQIFHVCGLKYVFGQYDHEAYSSHDNHVQILLPHLKVFNLKNLENIIGICPESYHLRCPSLGVLDWSSCPKLTTSHIMVGSEQRQQHLNMGVLLDGDEQNHLTANVAQLVLRELPELKSIWSGIIPMPVLSFPYLQCLKVDSCANLKSIFSTPRKRSLPELTSLSIWNCEKLEEIIAENEETQNLSNSEVFYPKLSELQIEKCNKLKSLFSVAMVRMLPQLSTIRISDAPQLELVFRHNGEDNTDNEDHILLPKLETIELKRLPCFVNIFQGYNFEAPKLQKLSTDECPKFGSILRGTQELSFQHTIEKGQVFWLITSLSNLQALTNLQRLCVTKSRAEGIFKLQVKELNSNSDWKALNLKLEYLMLSDLPELRFIWKGFSKFLSFEKLVKVLLFECPKLKTIFSPDIVRCLPKLKMLRIRNCEELEKIMSLDLENAQLRHPSSFPRQEVCFPQLYMIQVKQCNKLKCLFYDSMACHFPELKSLEIEDCSQLEQVFRSKGEADNESSQGRAEEDGDRILLPKLDKLVLKKLPIFFEISSGFNLQNRSVDYQVMDCPKYKLTSIEASTSCQHTTTHGESFDGA